VLGRQRGQQRALATRNTHNAPSVKCARSHMPKRRFHGVLCRAIHVLGCCTHLGLGADPQQLGLVRCLAVLEYAVPGTADCAGRRSRWRLRGALRGLPVIASTVHLSALCTSRPRDCTGRPACSPAHRRCSSRSWAFAWASSCFLPAERVRAKLSSASAVLLACRSRFSCSSTSRSALAAAICSSSSAALRRYGACVVSRCYPCAPTRGGAMHTRHSCTGACT
jgi:hypothetical protein